MRQIKFRGKPKAGYNYGKYWLYGSLLQIDDSNYDIIELSDVSCDENGYVDYSHTPIQLETIGQFTGLTDKNGKEIYEGDIIRVIIISHHRKYEIISDTICPTTFENGIFGLIHGNRHEFKAFSAFSHNVTFEIIGNIHDNPELLQK